MAGTIKNLIIMNLLYWLPTIHWQSLANTHDPKSGRQQADRDTAKIPPKPNQDHHRRHGHSHIGLYRTPLPRGEIECPTLGNVEISHQGKLFQTTKQSSCPSHAPFCDDGHQDSTLLAALSHSQSCQDLRRQTNNSEKTHLK